MKIVRNLHTKHLDYTSLQTLSSNRQNNPIIKNKYPRDFHNRISPRNDMSISLYSRTKVLHIANDGDRTFTYTTSGKYVVFLDNVSGVFRFEIEAPHVDLHILGAYIGKGDSRENLHTVQHHKCPQSNSNLLVKGVFEDASHFNYRGLIRIDKNCNGSHAYQKNQNLVLSDKVTVTSEPDLEILSNDVFCTHGSTTGGPNAEVLYYLQARGVFHDQAIGLIKDGFLQDVYESINQS